MKKVFAIIFAVILCFNVVVASANENYVIMYAPDGRAETIKAEHVEAWKNVGWYEYPVTTVYALDGRSEIIPQDNLSAWMNVGWYPYWLEITMYAPDGRTALVKAEDVEAWKNVGWFTEPCVAGYLSAYANEILYLINTYGRYESAKHGGVEGLKYGALIDFEKDDVPELVLLYDWLRVCVYRYDDGKVSRVYDTRVGGRFGQTDVSYTFGINESSAEPCLVTFQSKDEWYEERFHVFTIKNGMPYEKVIMKRSDRGLDEGSIFVHFEVNGTPVSKSTYEEEYNKVISGLYEIDACWPVGNGNIGRYNRSYKVVDATKEKLDAFLIQFGL